MRKKWSYVNVIHFGDRTDPASVHNIAKNVFYPSFNPRVYSRQMVCQVSQGEVWHLGIDQLFVEIERGSNQSKDF